MHYIGVTNAFLKRPRYASQNKYKAGDKSYQLYLKA
jgi:hypothetical protein